MPLPLSFFRKLVYFIPLFILPVFFGAKAVFFAEPISDIAGPAVTAILYSRVMPRLMEKTVNARTRMSSWGQNSLLTDSFLRSILYLDPGDM